MKQSAFLKYDFGKVSVISNNIIFTNFTEHYSNEKFNVEQAKIIDQRLQPLYHALSLASNPIPVKWALMSMRMIVGGIRLPLTPLAAEFQQTVKDALSKAGI